MLFIDLLFAPRRVINVSRAEKRPPPRAGKAAGQRSNPMNENASHALAYAAAATQLAAQAALDALHLTNDPAAWALGLSLIHI